MQESDLVEYIGQPIFNAQRMYDQTPVGVVMGLAWNTMGGSTLYIEVRSARPSGLQLRSLTNHIRPVGGKQWRREGESWTPSNREHERSDAGVYSNCADLCKDQTVRMGGFGVPATTKSPIG